MFSLIFPGQGSQIIGMAKQFYENFDFIREYFAKSDEMIESSDIKFSSSLYIIDFKSLLSKHPKYTEDALPT